MVEEKIKLINVRIDSTDIFLEDGERLGRGKITVSDTWRGAFTSSWGAMGGTISEFMIGINKEYFADNLLGSQSRTVFDPKGSVRNIRRYIREELDYELPWYKFMTAQKEMREELKGLERCESEEDFVNSCGRFVDGILCIDLNYEEEKEFKDIIRNMFESEPWNFIEQKYSPTYFWLCELHGKLVKRLKNDRAEKK